MVLGVLPVLGIVFIVLKLCNVIDWSWWWVTAPFWIPVGIVLVMIVIYLIIKVVVTIFE